MIAPKHAVVLNNCLTRPRADLDLAFVSFVFILAPLSLSFLWAVWPFADVLRAIWLAVTRKMEIS